MTPGEWQLILSLAEPWAHGGRSVRCSARAAGVRGGVGVYIAESHDGHVDYVGSVCRADDTTGIMARVAAHHVAGDRARHWARLWVVVLADATPVTAVRRIEGRIGRVLSPRSNQRMPAA